MEELFKYVAKGQQKTIDDLCRVVENYMRLKVDGDKFTDEKHFERAVRDMLEHEGFEVLKKQDVENTNSAVNERDFANVDRQIPDISIKCIDGLVFLELKFKRTLKVYQEDKEKCANYLKQGKCNAAGVLFLDNVKREGWKACRGNNDYNYYFEIGQ